MALPGWASSASAFVRHDDPAEMSALDRCASYEDYRTLVQRRLPRLLFDYVDGGSFSETTLRRNAADLAEVVIEQRVARDMSATAIGTTLFGQPLAMPLVLAPVGFAGMYARRGEMQAARAASAAGVPFCLSTLGICSAAELGAAGLPYWFQLYIVRDRGFVSALVDRIRALGCSTLVVTVDLPRPATRYRDLRSGMTGRLDALGTLRRWIDGATHPAWLWDVHLQGRPHAFGNFEGVAPAAGGFAAAWEWIGANFDESVTWDDLAALRAQWTGTLIVKGILHPDDARAAIAIGADGIVVSNHGGRQLDGASSTIAMLPRIAEAVDGAATVLVDGGIRSGLDLLKMAQAGADACLIGRAWVMALAAGGERGVTQLLDQFASQYRAGRILSGS